MPTNAFFYVNKVPLALCWRDDNEAVSVSLSSSVWRLLTTTMILFMSCFFIFIYTKYKYFQFSAYSKFLPFSLTMQIKVITQQDSVFSIFFIVFPNFALELWKTVTLQGSLYNSKYLYEHNSWLYYELPFHSGIIHY